jgi:hypothetical protein
LFPIGHGQSSAEETAAMATQGGECVPFAADVTKEAGGGNGFFARAKTKT